MGFSLIEPLFLSTIPFSNGISDRFQACALRRLAQDLALPRRGPHPAGFMWFNMAYDSSNPGVVDLQLMVIGFKNQLSYLGGPAL